VDSTYFFVIKNCVTNPVCLLLGNLLPSDTMCSLTVGYLHLCSQSLSYARHSIPIQDRREHNIALSFYSANSLRHCHRARLYGKY
jgi:hypothetical protein